MWTNLNLTDFKAFQTADLNLKPLTFLSGVNGSGKSTLVQAMAIIRQTVIENDWSEGIHLNGGSVSLGTVHDVAHQAKDPKEFSIKLSNEVASCKWAAVGTRAADLVADVSTVEFTPNGQQAIIWHKDSGTQATQAPSQALFRLIPAQWQGTYPQVQAFTEAISRIRYLGAERLGPRETYPLTTRTAYPGVGTRGEYTAHFLSVFGRNTANQGLTSPDDPQNIQDTVQAWLELFFPGFTFKIDPIQGASLVVLRFTTPNCKEPHRAQNVGYGITHALPIITACVGSKPGDTILLENPEAHLHPQGQSQIGDFLARTAASGVQVIVESHSDHVLNGIRKAIYKGQLSPHDALFNFVTASQADKPHLGPDIIESTCDKNGRIAPWPQKFFDQFETDLLQLP